MAHSIAELAHALLVANGRALSAHVAHAKSCDTTGSIERGGRARHVSRITIHTRCTISTRFTPYLVIKLTRHMVDTFFRDAGSGRIQNYFSWPQPALNDLA